MLLHKMTSSNCRITKKNNWKVLEEEIHDWIWYNILAISWKGWWKPEKKNSIKIASFEAEV